MLIESGKLLREAVRESDFVARLGGDEYAILLLSPTDPGGIEAVCERVMASFAAGIAFNNSTLSESCSVGVAIFPADGNTQERLYKSADMALYEAKRMGGNSWRHYREELSSAQAASGKNEM